MNKNLAFIAGCGHSGSTLLELLISSHSQCVGIGESFQLTEPYGRLQRVFEERPQRAQCACGDMLNDCEFWGPVIACFQSQPGLDKRRRYEMILHRVDELYPDKTIVVDSSKTVRALEFNVQSDVLPVRVIHLIRDVRSYMVSMQKAYRRFGQDRLSSLLARDGAKGVVRHLRHSRLYNFRSWHKINRRIDELVIRYRLPVLRVLYEDLCFDTENSMREIAAFLDLEFDSAMLIPTPVDCHNVFGNRMKSQADKSNVVSYDDRWLYDRTWEIPALLSPAAMSYNHSLTGGK